MKDLFVSYEQAVELKELGMDLGWDNYLQFYDYSTKEFCDVMKDVAAPLKTQVFRWFREKGFIISLDSYSITEHEFYIKWDDDKSILSNLYPTYEDMEDTCINKLIEIIKEK
jgi:hypothetical protein